MLVSYYLHKVLKFYVSQTKKLSQFFLLTVNISPQGLASALNSVGPLQGLKGSLQSEWLSSFTYLKKSRNNGSLSFVVTQCHSLSLDVIRCTTGCHSLYHSLSFVATRCHTLYHSLSLVVTYYQSMYHTSVFFINDSMKFGYLTEYKTRNIFLKKLCAKYDGETSLRNQSSSLLFSFFFTVCPSRGLTK